MPAVPAQVRPVRLHVTPSQRRRLNALVDAGGTPPTVRRRALIVLLSAAGESGATISTALGVTRRTISNTRVRWRRGALESLLDAPRAGRPPRAGPEYVARLLVAVVSDPRSFGYAFTRWTAPRLAAYLEATTGTRLSAAAIAALLRRHGFVWRRTKRTIRNLRDEGAVKRARRALQRLKKKPRRTIHRSNSGTPMA